MGILAQKLDWTSVSITQRDLASQVMKSAECLEQNKMSIRVHAGVIQIAESMRCEAGYVEYVECHRGGNGLRHCGQIFY